MNSFLSAFFGEALQLKRPKRCVLRCDVKGAAKGKLSRAPSQRFFSRNARYGRVVVLLGKMRENQMARSPVKHFAIRQKVTHCRVGQMTGPAHHALLDVPGIRTDLQHFEIVILLQNQEIGFAQMVFHEFGQIAKIGNDGNLDSIGFETVPHRVRGIMRNRERRHFDVTDFKFLAGMNVLHMIDRFLDALIFEHALNFAVRRLGKKRETFPNALQLAEAARMIGVFVGD